MNNNNADKITDLSYLISVCGDDPEFKKEMIETFLANTPALLDEMKTKIKTSDWKAIGDIAHKIKPSFSFMGINSARDLILDLERNGRQQEDILKIPPMVEKLDSICTMAFLELKDEMQKLS